MHHCAHTRLRCVAASLLAAATLPSPAAADPPPVEAFAALPAIRDVDISPNGNLLAWGDDTRPEPVLSVYDLTTKKFRMRSSLGKDVRLRDVSWSDDDTVLIKVSGLARAAPGVSERYTNYRLFSVSMKDGATHQLLMQGGSRGWVTGAVLHSLHAAKPHTVVMSTLDFAKTSYTQETGTRLAGGRKDAGWTYNLYEVDTTDGRGTLIEHGTAYTDEWVVDPAGRAAARSEWNPQLGQYAVLARRDLAWREIYSGKDANVFDLHGLSEDGKGILAIGAGDGGRQVLWSLALDGSGTKVVYADPTDDIEGVRFNPHTGKPMGVWLGGAEETFHWFDKANEDRARRLGQAFKDRWVHIAAVSADGGRAVVEVSSAAQPAVYYLADFGRNAVDTIGDAYPALVDASLGEVRTLSYPARDGTSIPAYLTLPPGADPKKLPLVVLPHGGPASRDNPGFDWWAQFLASRGYAVLQPQFRGSTGFGGAFRDAGRRQWGRLMQDDVTDGVNTMIAQGIVDPARVCIVGASYGGYAALAGATFTPDLYRCAVSVAGISDLPEYLYWRKLENGRESDTFAGWKDEIGLPEDPDVIGRSPARAADKVKIPVLLIHGANDTVVPIAQSEKMLRALQKGGKPVEFVKLDGEDHWLSKGETRLQMLKAIEAFLAKNL